MPRSVASYHSLISNRTDTNNDNNDEEDDYHVSDQQADAIRYAHRSAFLAQHFHFPPQFPLQDADAGRRRLPAERRSDEDVTSRGYEAKPQADERTGLLANLHRPPSGYRTGSAPGTPRLPRVSSQVNSIRNISRRGSFGRGLLRAFASTAEEHGDLAGSKRSVLWDDRVWYDQFTSTDWVHDSIADAYRVRELRSRKDFRGRLMAFFDGAQGWILVLVIGSVTAAFAYFIDVTEASLFDLKLGYCTSCWWYSRRQCCDGASICDEWSKWSSWPWSGGDDNVWTEWLAFQVWCVVLSLLSCFVTMRTKTTISSAISLSTLDENLGADHHKTHHGDSAKGAHGTISPTVRFQQAQQRPPVDYYPAAGSGVAEVRVILSGFVLHGYLGLRTLICKTIALILGVASGLSIGKEGPYVHIATCIGNIATRLTPKYRNNDAKRREVLSAAAAAGVAVAFGAPIGGVLFSLEEVSYFFPPKTLFRTFFCCIAAALSLKALNPYGTHKIVLFEVRYVTDWNFFEIFVFVCLGILGGVLGALFIKVSRWWAKSFRKIKVIKGHPMLEVFIVAVATGLTSYWNRYTRLPVAELLYEMSAPCTSFTNSGSSLCPTEEAIPATIAYLLQAFLIKAVLTIVTFGIKVPAGIYVPSMVVGGMVGRIVGHLMQLIILKYPDLALATNCQAGGNPESCVVPGVYALVAAGATMCGVTRLSVTLAVILFELTGSLEHVLPFSLGVLTAKWVADALEPLSVYDLLTDMNAYPYLDHKVRPLFDTTLGDLVPRLNEHRYIDITTSPWVPATQLRSQLEYLHMAGELDGGLAIIKKGVLVGLIPGPDLEYALDRIPIEEGALCLMDAHDQLVTQKTQVATTSAIDDASEDGDNTVGVGPSEVEAQRRSPGSAGSADPTDFTPYIDPAPMALDILSPMNLVFECFSKLGLRYICALQDGKYAGLVHKKTFVHYVKDNEHQQTGVFGSSTY